MAYPKSLLIESFCQASGPLCAMSGLKYEGRYALFISMRNVEFSGHVYPGDVIEHKAEIIKHISNACVFTGESRVGNRLIARYGNMVVATKNKE